MSLLQSDVGWYLPERLDDTDDGGGEMTLNPLLYGEQTNLFDDVDDVARTYGEVSIRLTYAAVSTADTQPLFGAHFVLAETPDDPNASILLGWPGSWGARRVAIADLISRYLAAGPKYQGFLWERQVEGSRVIMLFQAESAPVPAVGDALVLITHEGLVDQAEQYVRAIKVSTAVRQFTDGSGTFSRLIVTIELSTALESDFVGPEISRYDVLSSAAIVRTTVVADAVRFFGLKALTQPASLGALAVSIDNPYAQIIPASETEVSIPDLAGTPFRSALIAAGNTRRLASSVSGSTIYLGTAVLPGSVAISGSATLSDTGTGTATSGGVTAVLDYQRGIITAPYAGVWTVDATPAIAVNGAGHTYAIPVTQGNRGYVWTCLLPAGGAPARGVMTVDYRALERWYQLHDQGDGHLVSDGAGSGSIISDTVQATTTALPDIGTSVIFTWQTDLLYTRIDGTAIELPAYILELTDAVEPSSLTIAWTSGGQDKEAADNGTGGLTGDVGADGWILYLTGKIRLRPTAIPDPGTNFTCNYTRRQSLQDSEMSVTLTNSDRTITGSFSADLLPLKPGSLQLYVPISYWAGMLEIDQLIVLTDDSQGTFDNNSWVNFSLINMEDGYFSLTLKLTNDAITVTGLWGDGQGSTVTGPANPVAVRVSDAAIGGGPGGGAFLHYCATKDAPPETAVKVISPGPLQIELAPSMLGILQPGVQLRLGSTIYDDNGGGGILYTERDGATDVAVAAGTLNYAERTATITSVPLTPITSINILAGVVQYNVPPLFEVHSYVPSILKNGVTQFRATSTDGRDLTGLDQGDGTIVGDEMTGTIVPATGIYDIKFGLKVLAADLTDAEKLEPWYSPDRIGSDGKIFRPTAVIASTFMLATVGYTFLPLSKEILGLDPVRLPLDGRIQIFKVGDLAVIHHTDTVAVTTPSAGDTVDLGRTRLARIEVTAADADSTLVPVEKYSADLDAGTLTWATPLNTSGYPTPWTIAHTIEDMAVITDVTIDGQISLNLPLSHNFPDGSKISGAVVATQDLWARINIPFSQKTWTGVWSDTLIGDSTNWQYDYANYPITVMNIGTRQERWRIEFQTPTTFKCLGERSGQIATGVSKNVDFAPINPATAAIPGGPYPFFTLRAAGWGGGESQGDNLRFNTYAANYPIAAIRSIRPGPSVGDPSRFKLLIRGNTNV